MLKIQMRLIRRLRFRFIRLIVYFGFRLWLRKIHNIEKLPQEGPAIIVSNHTSYYDWSVLSAVYNKKYIVFLANKELLKRRFVNWLMRLNILIYIDKNNPGLRYFREVIRRLKQGHIVVIYPEGTRSKSGKMLNPKVGFVKLALITNTPIIPLGMKGAYEILPPSKRIPRFKKCEIFVGDKIYIEENNDMFKDIFKNGKTRKDLTEYDMKRVAIRIMNEINLMTGQGWESGQSIADEEDCYIRC